MLDYDPFNEVRQLSTMAVAKKEWMLCLGMFSHFMNV